MFFVAFCWICNSAISMGEAMAAVLLRLERASVGDCAGVVEPAMFNRGE